MDSNSQLYDYLIQAYARTYSLACAEDELRRKLVNTPLESLAYGSCTSEQISGSKKPPTNLSLAFKQAHKLRNFSIEQFQLEYEKISRSESPLVKSFHLLWYTYYNDLDLESCLQLEKRLSVDPNRNPCDLLLLQTERVLCLYSEGCVQKALELCARNLSALENIDTQDSVYKDYVLSLAYSYGSVLQRERGHFQKAHEQLQKALHFSTKHNFLLALQQEQQHATLAWISGQHELALELNCKAEIRSRALELGKYRFLAISHMNACKCAIDLKQPEIAQQELQACAELLAKGIDCSVESSPQATEEEQHDKQQPTEVKKQGDPKLRAYLTLYKGELEMLLGHPEKAQELLRQACDEFENLDHMFFPGQLDSKIALAKLALQEGAQVLFFVLIRSLLEEAEERGLLEARSRLLVMESQLFVTDAPPLKQAYDELATRVHLINNPALLLEALGNLHAYSIRFLDEKEQAFLHQRILNLREVLPRSCFHDLYENHVYKTYRKAVEASQSDLE